MRRARKTVSVVAKMSADDRKQIKRVLSHALASGLRNLLGFDLQLMVEPEFDDGHIVTIRLYDRHWPKRRLLKKARR